MTQLKFLQCYNSTGCVIHAIHLYRILSWVLRGSSVAAPQWRVLGKATASQVSLPGREMLECGGGEVCNVPPAPALQMFACWS